MKFGFVAWILLFIVGVRLKLEHEHPNLVSLTGDN